MSEFDLTDFTRQWESFGTAQGFITRWPWIRLSRPPSRVSAVTEKDVRDLDAALETLQRIRRVLPRKPKKKQSPTQLKLNKKARIIFDNRGLKGLQGWREALTEAKSKTFDAENLETEKRKATLATGNKRRQRKKPVTPEPSSSDEGV